MPRLEINGTAVEAPAGTSILQAAEQVGIYIPRFCYHHYLSVAANCRMCLVSVAKAPKPLPACATPVAEGMVVQTADVLARGAQQSMMEMLLINHPLDCPVCDQGGECELQDLALTHGKAQGTFDLEKRAVPSPNLGPLIATEMTRCIHCTRCVRFGVEIAGIQEMGGVSRGDRLQIVAAVGATVDSELSGNMIDLCPVGALTSKPARFTGRPWELRQYPGIAPYDGLGSHVFWHVAHDRVRRVVPRLAPTRNEVWLSDRDRFGYTGLQSAERLLRPHCKTATGWIETDWDTAIARAAACLSGSGVAALVHPSTSLEAGVRVSEWVRQSEGLGVCTRLRAMGEGVSVEPTLGCSLEALETSPLIVTIGVQIDKAFPMVGHRIRKAVRAGGALYTIHSRACLIPGCATTPLQIAPQDWLSAITALADAVTDGTALEGPLQPLYTALGQVQGPVRWLLGPLALDHPEGAAIHAQVQRLAAAGTGTVGCLAEGANAAGLHPLHSISIADAYAAERYLLVHVDPHADLGAGRLWETRLQHAAGVVAISAFHTPSLQATATVLLPATCAPEEAGRVQDLLGAVHAMEAIVPPPGAALPTAAVLDAIIAARGIRTHAAHTGTSMPPFSWNAEQGLCCVRPTPPYGVDAVLRHAVPLQETRDAREGLWLRLHPSDSAGLSGNVARVSAQGRTVDVPFESDPTVLPGTAYWESGGPATAILDHPFTWITVEPVS